MHIAFITTEFITEKSFDGGLSNYLYRTCLSLQALGHKTSVIVSTDKNETITKDGITVVRVKPARSWWFWLINVFTLFRLNPALLQIQRSASVRKALLKYHKLTAIDIVQYSSTMSIAILQPSKIPSVVRISSYQRFIDEQSGTPVNFRLKQKLYLNDLMLKRSQNLFGPSKIIGEFISKSFQKKVILIESPFTMSTIELQDSVVNQILDNTSGSPYLLYFGSLSKLKGLEDIAAILYRILDENPNYHFVFVGKDIPINGASVVDLLKEKAGKHSGRVQWFNGMPHASLYPVIKGAELVVLPSRIDNFPNTCIEAMAFGKVVVGTYQTSFEQLITNEVSGLLCNHSSPDELFATVQKGINLTPEAKLEIGKAAMARIDTLKPELVIKQLAEYYQSVIKEFKG